jgi:hypothetical protein
MHDATRFLDQDQIADRQEVADFIALSATKALAIPA